MANKKVKQEAPVQHITVDTTSIQCQSVINFMNALGYTLDRSRVNGSFINIGQLGKAANLNISFATASQLHNTEVSEWQVLEGGNLAVYSPEGKTLHTAFRPVNVLLAHASKLVAKSKVQFTRRGQIVMNSEGAHLVRPLNKIVSEMLGL